MQDNATMMQTKILTDIASHNTLILSSNRFQAISVALFQQRYFLEFGSFNFAERTISSFPEKMI